MYLHTRVAPPCPGGLSLIQPFASATNSLRRDVRQLDYHVQL
jgi:hypothetical protein